MKSYLAIAVALLHFQGVEPYAKYCSLIPNANNVADCALLGHPTSSGRTGQNSFGKAFATAGRVWTAELCKADSDADGQTNGQELGDPCCEWTTTNSKVQYSSGLSNPGVKAETVDNSLFNKVNCTQVTPITTNTTQNGAPNFGLSAGVTLVSVALAVKLALH